MLRAARVSCCMRVERLSTYSIVLMVVVRVYSFDRKSCTQPIPAIPASTDASERLALTGERLFRCTAVSSWPRSPRAVVVRIACMVQFWGYGVFFFFFQRTHGLALHAGVRGTLASLATVRSPFCFCHNACVVQGCYVSVHSFHISRRKPRPTELAVQE